MKLVKYKDAPIRDFGKGLNLQILLDKENGAKNLDVGIVEIAPKSETSMHVRLFEEVIMILKGQGQVVTEDGQVFILDENDCILIPAGVNHKHVNNTDKIMKQLYIFAPQSPNEIQKQLRSLSIAKK